MSSSDSSTNIPKITAIIPAAGIGQRMGKIIPKQYLQIGEKTVLEHTAEILLTHPNINSVVIVINEKDAIFSSTPLAQHPMITTATGGESRADSVLAGVRVAQTDWIMVHDAARPCLQHHDINQLIHAAFSHTDGAILATPVKDTMKRANAKGQIQHSESREQLWHALTPQMFTRAMLQNALETAKQQHISITDEASAIEFCGGHPLLVKGNANNIKITLPEDLSLAACLLQQKNI